MNNQVEVYFSVFIQTFNKYKKEQMHEVQKWIVGREKQDLDQGTLGPVPLWSHHLPRVQPKPCKLKGSIYSV
jgi:hypothetical protein